MNLAVIPVTNGLLKLTRFLGQKKINGITGLAEDLIRAILFM